MTVWRAFIVGACEICGKPAACSVWLQVFSGSRSTRTEEEVIAHSALQQEWRRLQGDSSAGAAAAEPTEASKPVEGDCPICYDEMHPGGDTLQVSWGLVYAVSLGYT